MIGDLLDNERERFVKDLSFWCDIQTGKIIQGNTDDGGEQFLASEEFQGLIAQIKFMDGALNEYSQMEEKQLRLWLKANKPTVMKDYFHNKILGSRPEDLDRFPTSQIAEIFNDLIPV